MEKKDGELSDEKILLLNKIGFVWDIKEKLFEETYEELKEWRKLNPNVWPSTSSENLVEKKLATWSVSRRLNRKKGILSQEHIKLLDEINFDWDPIATQFKENYEKLKKWRETNPNRWPLHRSKNSIEKELGIWSSVRRKDKKKGILSQEHIKLLDEINFDWDPIATQFKENYEKLKKWRETNPNRWPSQQSSHPVEKELGSWCSNKRHRKRINKLSAEKIKKLDEIGFLWNMPEGIRSPNSLAKSSIQFKPTHFVKQDLVRRQTRRNALSNIFKKILKVNKIKFRFDKDFSNLSRPLTIGERKATRSTQNNGDLDYLINVPEHFIKLSLSWIQTELRSLNMVYRSRFSWLKKGLKDRLDIDEKTIEERLIKFNMDETRADIQKMVLQYPEEMQTEIHQVLRQIESNPTDLFNHQKLFQVLHKYKSEFLLQKYELQIDVIERNASQVEKIFLERDRWPEHLFIIAMRGAEAYMKLRTNEYLEFPKKRYRLIRTILIALYDLGEIDLIDKMMKASGLSE